MNSEEKDMPPKSKCTKEDIVKTAFEMTKENGIESVAARELGKRLGTSATPIFTHFKNMREVAWEVRKLAMQEFEKYTEDALNYSPAFKQFGIKMVQFAKEEPKLFQVLYMQEHEGNRSFADVFEELGEPANVCIKVIRRDYDLTEEEAYIVFREVWLHTFSICVLEANNTCHFSAEEVSEMLSLEFQSIFMMVKSGKYKQILSKK